MPVLEGRGTFARLSTYDDLAMAIATEADDAAAEELRSCLVDKDVRAVFARAPAVDPFLALDTVDDIVVFPHNPYWRTLIYSKLEGELFIPPVPGLPVDPPALGSGPPSPTAAPEPRFPSPSSSADEASDGGAPLVLGGGDASSSSSISVPSSAGLPPARQSSANEFELRRRESRLRLNRHCERVGVLALLEPALASASTLDRRLGAYCVAQAIMFGTTARRSMVERVHALVAYMVDEEDHRRRLDLSFSHEGGDGLAGIALGRPRADSSSSPAVVGSTGTDPSTGRRGSFQGVRLAPQERPASRVGGGSKPGVGHGGRSDGDDRTWTGQWSGFRVLALLTSFKIQYFTAGVLSGFLNKAVRALAAYPVLSVRHAAALFVESLLLVLPALVTPRLDDVRLALRDALVRNASAASIKSATGVLPDLQRVYVITFSLGLAAPTDDMAFLRRDMEPALVAGHRLSDDLFDSHLDDYQVDILIATSLWALGSLDDAQYAPAILVELRPFLCSPNKRWRQAAVRGVLSQAGLVDSGDLAPYLWMALPLVADPHVETAALLTRFASGLSLLIPRIKAASSRGGSVASGSGRGGRRQRRRSLAHGDSVGINDGSGGGESGSPRPKQRQRRGSLAGEASGGAVGPGGVATTDMTDFFQGNDDTPTYLRLPPHEDGKVRRWHQIDAAFVRLVQSIARKTIGPVARNHVNEIIYHCQVRCVVCIVCLLLFLWGVGGEEGSAT